MLSEKQIEALKKGAYGVTRDGRKALFATPEGENVDVWLVFTKNKHTIPMKFIHGYKTFNKLQSDGDNDLDIVGLWENRPEPFNLERALAGEPVLLKNKKKAYLLSNLSETNKTDLSALFDLHGLIGVTEDDPYRILKWSLFRHDVIHSDESYSIIGMWKEPEPIKPSVDLPKPIREFGYLETVWYVNKTKDRYAPYGVTKNGDWLSTQYTSLSRGCYYATKEDCQAVCDWLMNR